MAARRSQAPRSRGARLTVTFRHADGGEATHAGLFDPQGEAVAAASCLS